MGHLGGASMYTYLSKFLTFKIIAKIVTGITNAAADLAVLFRKIRVAPLLPTYLPSPKPACEGTYLRQGICA